MKIEHNLWARSASTVTRTSYVNKAATFQDALASQMLQRKSDSVIISGLSDSERLQEKEDIPAATNVNTIVSTDSVQIKLEKLQKIAENANYSGMSYEEIYCTIWNRYQQAFDGKMPAIISCLIGGEDWADINNQFVNEVKGTVYHPLFLEIKNETGLCEGTKEFDVYWEEHYANRFSSAALGYGGLSMEEKEQAIREKYAGCHSLYDFASMMGELSDVGVLSHQMGNRAASSYMNMIGRELVYRYFPDQYNACPTDEDWGSILHQSFDAREFAIEMTETLKKIKFENWAFDIQSILSKGHDSLFKAIFR